MNIISAIGKNLHSSLLLGSLLFFFTGTSPAATIKGIQFEDEITVGGQTLSLHGIGLLKWKYIVDVYLVALYKQKGIAIDKINTNVPKRLEYYFFVDFLGHRLDENVKKALTDAKQHCLQLSVLGSFPKSVAIL